MKKSPLYTRTGDNGTTSLVDGSRVAKNSQRIEAYGTVDELNSFIGALIAAEPLTGSDRNMLTDIQARLFDIGSYLAAGNAEMSARLLPDLTESLQRMEATIDLYDSQLPPLHTFVLPQGAPSAAAAHVARTVARRAERCIIALSNSLALSDSSDKSDKSDNSDKSDESDSSDKSVKASKSLPAGIDSNVLRYVNRLSDYLFILSRHCNHLAGIDDICWTPAKTK